METKKRKNVEVLWIAAAVSRPGIHYVSIKIAENTSMVKLGLLGKLRVLRE